jgi:Na+-driven multidrug efflux pump
MISQISGTALNLIFDPILIFGLFGFPDLGMRGAAIATVFAQFVSAALAMIFHFRVNYEIRIKAGHFRVRPLIFGRILSIGVSSIAKQGVGAITLFFINGILLGFTVSATAVYGAYNALLVFLMTPVWALTNVLVPLIGFNYGAKKRLRIIKLFKLCMLYAFAVTALGGLALAFFPRQFLSLFNTTDNMYAIGAAAFIDLGVALPLRGMVTVFLAAMQGLGEGGKILIA